MIHKKSPRSAGRGTAPNRARRGAGRIKKGEKLSRGRPPGAKNYWTREVKEAILDAANELGEDGHGYDGLKGYMKFLGSTELKTFGMLIRAVMPTQVTVEHKDVKIDTVEDVEKELASIGLWLEDLRPFKFHTPEQVLELMARDVTDDADDSK
jgi:hypothetical protein